MKYRSIYSGFSAFILLIFFTGRLIAQDAIPGVTEPKLPYPDGKFAVWAGSNGERSYYYFDLTQLPTRFDKVCFMNLLYKNEPIVSMDSDIRKDQLQVMAESRLTEKQVLDELDQLKQKVAKTAASMNEAEKTTYLKTNDKFFK